MKHLVGYITTSFPNKNFTIDLALSMKENGVDILELGIPFSDPVADGSIIEKANLLALQNGFCMDDLFDVSKAIGPHMDTFWMGYMNPFYKRGFEYFLQKAADFQIKGMIIPDLPHEETLGYQSLFDSFNKSIISFVAPTDSKERINTLVANAKDFIYLVAYAGITGSGKTEDLTEVIANIKSATTTPVYIGFGVDEKTAKQKAQNVDGVIVGSAFVKHLLDDSLSSSAKIQKVSQIAKEIKEQINS